MTAGLSAYLHEKKARCLDCRRQSLSLVLLVSFLSFFLCERGRERESNDTSGVRSSRVGWVPVPQRERERAGLVKGAQLHPRTGTATAAAGETGERDEGRVRSPCLSACVCV